MTKIQEFLQGYNDLVHEESTKKKEMISSEPYSWTIITFEDLGCHYCYRSGFGLEVGVSTGGRTRVVVPHTRTGENNPKAKAAVARDGQMKSLSLII